MDLTRASPGWLTWPTFTLAESGDPTLTYDQIPDLAMAGTSEDLPRDNLKTGVLGTISTLV